MFFDRGIRKPYRCKGKTIRRICHLNTIDMSEIYSRNTLSDGRQNCFVANKFNNHVDSNAIICAARRIHLQEYLSIDEDMDSK